MYCVPDLQLDFLLGDLDDLRPEFNANGGVMIEFKLLLEKLQKNAGFAHTYNRLHSLLVSPMMIYLKRKEYVLIPILLHK